MKSLRVKDKQSDIFRSLFCLSGEITAHLFRIRPHTNSSRCAICWQNTVWHMLNAHIQ